MTNEQSDQHLKKITETRRHAVKALKALGKGYKAAILFHDGTIEEAAVGYITYVIYGDSKQLTSNHRYDIGPDTGSCRTVLEIVDANTTA